MYSAVTERCFMMEASGVHRQEALIRQAVNHVSPLACTVGLHGFLKEASTCRIEAPLDICFYHRIVLSKLELEGELVHCILCPKMRTIPIATAQEILFIDGCKYPRDRKLE